MAKPQWLCYHSPHETNVAAKKTQARKDAWLSGALGECLWSQCTAPPPPQRAREALGLTNAKKIPSVAV